MNDLNVVFCGLSKNCENTIEVNLKNLLALEELVNFKYFKIIIVDSSTDRTKEIIKKYQKISSSIVLISEDNIDKRVPNRIERISICRNICLDVIKKMFKDEKIIYIPIDLDLELFKSTQISNFKKVLENFYTSNEYDAIFPINNPYYYDIFALRAKNWNSDFSQLFINYTKKYIPFSSFFINYLFIFRKQLSIEKIKNKQLKIWSAFSGAGMYKICADKLGNIKYSHSLRYPELISEHVFFNKNFNNLKLEKDWVIEAPHEHIRFKLLNSIGKVNYFLKTIKYDFLRFFNFLR